MNSNTAFTRGENMRIVQIKKYVLMQFFCGGAFLIKLFEVGKWKNRKGGRVHVADQITVLIILNGYPVSIPIFHRKVSMDD
ncbi:MAG: hypothetical protein HLUCCX10_12975 [Algoriphagus marincola HL-49]|uniref:Uncharacterized protein n=1 Tax=Algoriphagus marincola HL-49 TaxID=1305737 RepID=A0A0P7YFS3_9BACT|nr:MAG: hypothetical protein HLUCCX10_12975 [Algoriphagus marincola HL-49]